MSTSFPCGNGVRRRRMWVALVAGATVAGLGTFAGLAASQAAGDVGWHQTPFASESYAAWLDRTGSGAVLARGYDPTFGSPGPWVERPLLPDGNIGPEAPLDPLVVPEQATVLGGGSRVILSTPEGLIAQSGAGWSPLGDPGLPGRLEAARSNERGDVLVGDGRRFAIRANGRWVRSASIGPYGTAETALGENGSAVVAWTPTRQGSVLARIQSIRYVPGSGWRHLPALKTADVASLGGVAIDGSGIATLVYSVGAAGVQSRTLAPGQSTWARPVRVGPGDVSSAASDLAGNVWAVTEPDRSTTRLAVMTRAPGGGWRRSAAFDGVAPSLLVTPLGEVTVSMISSRFDATWSVEQRDSITGRWASVPGFYVGRAATNRAGDIISAHIHPIEQGNRPSAFIDRFLAPARAVLSDVRAPTRIRRGAAATIRARASRAGPVLVTVTSGPRRQIAASAVARRAGAIAVTLPGRLTRLLPLGRARITVDTGGHDRAGSMRSVPVLITNS